jgi:hypothetical protein
MLYFKPLSRLLSLGGLSLAMLVCASLSEVKDIPTSRDTKFEVADPTSKSKYAEEDIVPAVEKLSQLGSGFRTIEVRRSTMIVSVAGALDDGHQLMAIAENDNFGSYGIVNIGQLIVI